MSQSNPIVWCSALIAGAAAVMPAQARTQAPQAGVSDGAAWAAPAEESQPVLVLARRAEENTKRRSELSAERFEPGVVLEGRREHMKKR